MRDLLIMPVQRIPRYSMLLADMVKLTESDHLDYSDLSQAGRSMVEIADLIDNLTAHSQSLTKLMQLSQTVLNKKGEVCSSRSLVRTHSVLTQREQSVLIDHTLCIATLCVYVVVVAATSGCTSSTFH